MLHGKETQRRRFLPASSVKWLVPGMGVKRWLGLLGFAIALMGMGIVYLLLVLYRAGVVPGGVYRALTLQFLHPIARIAVPTLLGLLLIGLAVSRLNRSIIAPFVRTGGQPLAEAVYQLQRRKRGPHIVAIGGGHGLSTLLRGLKQHTGNLTAIITVADDGGSSGRLRRELGLPPPGDFRNCIAALSNDEALITQLLQYRFGLRDGEDGDSDLSGHSFGNLLIAALAGVTGSFERALEQSGQILAIQGSILPSTLADVTLVADVREQSQEATVRRVAGESHIPHTSGVIERVYLDPEYAPAYPAAVRAVLTADLVALGPGSLYTSVLPNLLVRGMRQALKTTRAPVVYVCNVANQPGETEGYDVRDHLLALERHIGRGIIDVVLANSAFPALGSDSVTQFVPLGSLEHLPLISQDLIDQERPWRHDSGKLAKTILTIHSSHQKGESLLR